MTKTYDLNAWAAGSGEWLEVSSISNANDYQARRANIRFRREAGGKTEYPAHAERLGRGAAEDADRDARKQPAGGRLGGHPRSAAAVSGRHGDAFGPS